MDWAAQKRLKYFFILGLILAGILIAIILPVINRPATCSDKKQNASESGVDCGGTCEYLCKNDVNEVQVSWSRALPSGPKRVNLIAYIQNSNKTAGVSRAPYKFTVYDSKGAIIQTNEGFTDIAANTATAVFAGPIDIGERKVQSTTFEWTGDFGYKTQSEKALDSVIKIVNTNIERSSTTVSLSANLRNLTRANYKNIPVVAIIYDKDDNAVLASRTVLDDIAGDRDATAVFFWNLAFEGDVSKIEILPIISEFVK